MHSERPKLYTILAFLSAIGLKQGSRFSVDVKVNRYTFKEINSAILWNTFLPFHKGHFFREIFFSLLEQILPIRVVLIL